MKKEAVPFRSGFVNIFGYPNVGKSTLMNQLLGERMSIITPKAQTTRHRIIGILTQPAYQIVFSDTPGRILDPAYKMQETMNSQLGQAMEDADIAIFMTEVGASQEDIASFAGELGREDIPKYLIINKIDLASGNQVADLTQQYQSLGIFDHIFPLAASQGLGIDKLMEQIINDLPEGPAYYPEEQLTDRSERFFISEIIRGKILELYHQEVPYSVEVAVQKFKEETGRKGPFIHIEADIYVMRKSQKAILIGKGGSAIKTLGTEARKVMEDFLEKHVFLELFVKVKEDWRDDDRMLKYFGYKS